MTEDEAKAKWCPFARVGSGMSGLGSLNRDAHADGIMRVGQLPDEARCIGSACMAWRTRHQWFDNAQDEPSWVSYAPYAFEPGPGQERDDGFCGLAGAPS